MKLDDRLNNHLGWSGSCAVTAREFFRRKAEAELNTPHARRSPAMTDEWLRQLVEFLDSEPTITLPEDLDL